MRNGRCSSAESAGIYRHWLCRCSNTVRVESEARKAFIARSSPTSARSSRMVLWSMNCVRSRPTKSSPAPTQATHEHPLAERSPCFWRYAQPSDEIQRCTRKKGAGLPLGTVGGEPTEGNPAVLGDRRCLILGGGDFSARYHRSKHHAARKASVYLVAVDKFLSRFARERSDSAIYPRNHSYLEPFASCDFSPHRYRFFTC